ncbi:GNAT family N-acetyltransferase [Denitratisoma sp. DHT3]|uniref:GNAT family N-acetyltransferase n=1 Tax=Denitratisoma sp. DHT3 TaxID=1981880 RepID=UPI0021BDA383|nr:GNAT family N-acetyltransferase [Denitratisoma sp. DHT3]
MREQGIAAAEEWDRFDAAAHHAVAYGPAGEPIGTGRLLDDGRIGRMAVLAPWRGKGVGSALLDRLLEAAARAGMAKVRLHARQSAATFYRQQGFVQQGEPFQEVGTSHVLMERRLAPPGDRA